MLGMFLLAGVISGAPIDEDAWSYERLTRESDAVVMASFAGEETLSGPARNDFKPMKVIGKKSSFRVAGRFKGEVPDTINVVHYIIDPDAPSMNASQLFVLFRMIGLVAQVEGSVADAARYRTGAPDYLFFLKKGENGDWVPTSGQLVAGHSVREVYRPINASTDGKRVVCPLPGGNQ